MIEFVNFFVSRACYHRKQFQNLSINLFIRKDGKTSGVFWHNAAETWVDITSSSDNNVVESIVNFVSGSTVKPQVNGHFMSESGVIDVFLMLGPNPLDAFKQYTRLTGTGPLPQVIRTIQTIREDSQNCLL